MSIVAPQKILGVILQAGKGVDAVGAGADLLPGVVREGVEIALGLRLTAQQGVQIGVVLHEKITSGIWFAARGKSMRPIGAPADRRRADRFPRCPALNRCQ